MDCASKYRNLEEPLLVTDETKAQQQLTLALDRHKQKQKICTTKQAMHLPETRKK